MSNKSIAVIEQARSQIEALGWVVDEFVNDSDECHLEFNRGDYRVGWGLFDRLYCWTEAFERLTGKSWQTLT